MRLRQAIKIVKAFRKNRPKLRAYFVIWRHRRSKRLVGKYFDDPEFGWEWVKVVEMIKRRKRRKERTCEQR